MPTPILIVEDELAIADTIAYALRTEGFLPQRATLGAQALAILQASTAAPALVVLDVGLPDLNGFEVCRRLRRFSDVPVIFLTARDEEIDRVVGLEIGADDYVTKPFSPRELMARIRVILRRTGERHAPPAAPAKFELRALEARIFFCGRPLDLTRYEYLLLKILIERAGQVLSRAQLMDHVWSDAPDTLDRTVDAHIKSLRAKLRAIEDGSDPIQTHRSMGYSLAAA